MGNDKGTTSIRLVWSNVNEKKNVMRKLYDGELEENVAFIASYTMDETNRVRYNLFCGIEPSKTGASGAGGLTGIEFPRMRRTT